MLDIDAAPGSWTAFLHDQLGPGTRVVAVDPAALSPEVLARPGVAHVRACVSAADPQGMALIASAIATDGDGAAGGAEASGAGMAALVVCDMNCRPRQCAMCIVELAEAGLLQRGCCVVMTLKMHRRAARHRKAMEQEALGALSAAFSHVRVDWLFANTQFEATITCVWDCEL